MSHETTAQTYIADPLNRGAALDHLRSGAITPTAHFFVRNHAPIPSVDPAAYRLAVDGLVGQPLAFTLDDLLRLPAHTVTATLQCAGHRRRELTELERIDAAEIVWDADAISTATWTGVRLGDILQQAGPQSGAAHVAFLGLDHIDKTQDGFGGSIPLAKAQSSEVLLAYAMNGAPLAPTHGYPLRVLAPGYIGARSVKWVGRITVQAQPSANYFQAHAYKRFPPEVRGDNVDWEQGEMLGELPINSFITSPCAGAACTANPLTVQGVALPGGDAVLTRVEVSCDGGQHWQTATLTGPLQPWTWCVWETTCTLNPGRHELVARAFDSAGHAQPAQLAAVWNFKGYVNNAYHRVAVTLED